GVSVSGRDISLKPGGYLRLSVEIRYIREGMLKNQAITAPDRTVVIDVPTGTYPVRALSVPLVLPMDKMATLTYILEGEKFTGEAIFEEPTLYNPFADFNVMPPFAPDSPVYKECFNWYGVNLSHTEWPKMKVELNGRTVFDADFFERCHRYSENEFSFAADALKKGVNTLKFINTCDWNGALPYRLREVGLVSEPSHSFDLVSFPETAVRAKPFSILLDVRDPARLSVTGGVRVLSDTDIKAPGLYGISLAADSLAVNVPVSVTDGVRTESFVIKRVIDRPEDGVITGTGDLIYINQNPESFKNYIKWYCSNRIGQLMTVRPTYRWSGSRKYDLSLWRDFMRVLDSMGMNYPHMLDGREPNGYCAQPSLAEFSEGKGFLGRQLHERDGAYNYWGSYEHIADFWNVNDVYDTSLFFDSFHRQRRLDPEHAGSEFYPEDFFNDGKRWWICHDPSLPADAKVRAESVMNSMSLIRKGATRHTGPSIMFKYFLMSGYTWVGAETMDSPTEFLMAALRGASEAWGIKSVGVHHALQWSSSPHEDPKRYRRYRLALYVSWMHGAHQNNTEEGLWHMEEFYESHHRHGVAAKEHLKMQQDFNRYIQTHCRRGVLKAGVAILHGRYDGAACFGGGSPWGARKQDFSRDFDAEESWFIPRNLFYPNAKNRRWGAAQHRGKFDGPIGLVSGNPLGNFNIVPVERQWRKYPLLAFFGYNCLESADADRILGAVRSGSTLLCTAAHLSDTTLRADTEAYRLSFISHPIFEILGFSGGVSFSDDSVGGVPVRIGNLDASGAEVLKTSDSGLPLVISRSVGEGRIVFFNAPLYPAAAPIKELYAETFRELSEEVRDLQRIRPAVDEKVQATSWVLEDGCEEIYYIAVDWWNDPEPEREAALIIGKFRYDVRLSFGVMKKVRVSGDKAVMADTESADILSLDGDRLVVQGEGVDHFTLFADGVSRCFTVDFTDCPQKEVSVSSLIRDIPV
ncbi:MAG: hypothetical protein IJV00_09485, partial [Clostridia bacterium]|nr:hypothetical protein [Clostridia bacterium]